MKRLNIGCGRDYRDGWTNVDISREVKADFYIDIRKDSLENGGEFDEIYISGVLEQILENEHLIHAMNECHKLLKYGGLMTVVVPNAKYAIAHRDPMDVRKFTRETFQYFLKGAREHDLYGSVYGFKGWTTLDIQENERHILTIKMRK